MRINTITALFITSLISLGSAVHAEVYMHTDANGKVSFSNSPASTSKGEITEKIKLQETNSAPAIEPRLYSAPEVKKITTSYEVRITSPSDGDTFTNEVRDLTVSANISPSVAKDHSLVATLNGQRAVNQSSQGSSVVIRDIDRGEQEVQLQVLDAAGKMVAKSQTVRVNIIRRNLPRPAKRAL
jgi:hypothetical protein